MQEFRHPLSNYDRKGVNMMMQQEISIIAGKLMSEYLDSESYPENIDYETAVKLNVEMIEKALTMYHEKVSEQSNRRL